MSIYGTIISGNNVADRIETFIRKWSVTYIAEVGFQNGYRRTELPGFASYTRSAHGVDKWSNAQVPACIIVVPSLTGVIEHSGDGTYNLEWSVGIGSVCSSRSIDETTELAQMYTAAMRALMLQHGSMDGFSSGIRLVDERYDPLSFNDSRTLAAGIVNLGIMVPSVLNSRLGPMEPPVDPYLAPGDWGEVQVADAVTERLE